MIIVIYGTNFLAGEYKSTLEHFIVQTLSVCFEAHIKPEFVLLNAGKAADTYSESVGHHKMKPEPQTSIGKRIWWDITLPKVLKKLKTDIFVSIGDRCSLNTLVPQCLVITDLKKVKQQSLIKAATIVVFSKSIKQTLLAMRHLTDQKISVVQPCPAPQFKPITEHKKAEIKDLFSEGKEFFLYYHCVDNNENLIELLKAFSLFKKRQGSGLKLLVLGKINGPIEKSLSTYKYRHDVNWIPVEEKTIITEVTASAYTAILPFNTAADPFIALNAMNAGVPVITSKISDVHEIAGDSVLPAETNSAKGISEKMMQIYIDENLRSALIEKGRVVAQNFTLQRSAEQMWQAFMKALN